MNLDNYLLSRKILRLASLELKRRNAHLKVLDQVWAAKFWNISESMVSIRFRVLLFCFPF